MRFMNILSTRVCAAVLVSILAGCGRNSESVGPSDLSLAGVVFRIPDSRALVRPPNYLTRQDIRAPVGRVSSFPLCAEIPQMQIRFDQESLRACRELNDVKGSYAVIDVVGESVGGEPPSPESRPAESFGLAPQLQFRAGLQGSFAPKPMHKRDRFSYAPAPEQFGLHVLEPHTNIDPSVDVIFWQGKSIESVATLISCSPYLPEQIRAYKWQGYCKHEFLLPSAMFAGHTVTVTIYYNSHWLQRWSEIEKNTRQKIQDLRTESNTSHEE